MIPDSVDQPADNNPAPATTAFQLGLDAGMHEQQRRTRLALSAHTDEPLLTATAPTLTERLAAAARAFRNPYDAHRRATIAAVRITNLRHPAGA